jgi:hypothetical protein
MSNATNYFEASNLNTLAAGHVALFTAVADAEAGTVTEVSGGSYARVALTGKFPTATAGNLTNDAEIAFPEATASWGTVTHAGIYDAASGGNLLWVSELSSSATISAGQIFKFAVSNLTLTAD